MISHPALQALTDGFIDYAGLFPPAKLPLAEALAEFESARHHPQGSFLSRFVLPANRFPEAADFLVAAFSDVHQNARPPWHFSVLLRACETGEVFFKGLAEELDAVATLLERAGGAATIDSFELVLPGDTLAAPHLTEGFARVCLDALGKTFPGAHAYFEIPWTVPPGEALVALSKVGGARAKFRTGGLAPSSVPAVESLCDALVVCTARGLPCKFTAGLHEPLRHFDAGVGTTLHGFLNVFLAASFLALKEWDRPRALALLASEHASDFSLTDDGIAFQGEALSTADLRRSREAVALSFGSCSFLEPVEGLRRMGFLPDAR